MTQGFHDFGFLGQGHYAHGTRQNYLTGCKCTPCRSANALYEQQRLQARAHGEPVWVSPDKARAQLERLGKLGIGYRQAATLAGISWQTVRRIRKRMVRRILARVEQAILGITKPFLARGVRVNGYETRHYVESLVREDYALPWLAQQLGLKCGCERLGQLVTVGTALRVRRLHARLTR